MERFKDFFHSICCVERFNKRCVTTPLTLNGFSLEMTLHPLGDGDTGILELVGDLPKRFQEHQCLQNLRRIEPGTPYTQKLTLVPISSVGRSSSFSFDYLWKLPRARMYLSLRSLFSGNVIAKIH